MTRRLALVAALLVLLAAPAHAATVCDRFDRVEATGTIESDDLTEISGVVESRVHPGVLWVHNDSGGRASLWATDVEGHDLGEYVVPGVEAFDWEDIAIGADGIYIGDIGDNLVTRDHVEVHRVPEPTARPDGTGGTFASVDTFELTYPTGPVNAEAMFVAEGDIWVLTKEDDRSRVFRAPPADGTFEAVGQFEIPEPSSDVLFGLPGNLVTGADASPDGSIVLVRTYRAVLAFEGTDFGRPPCEAPSSEETQGEAVGFVGAGYVTVGEGSHVDLHRFVVLDEPPPSTTTTTEPEPASPSATPLVLLVAAVVVLSGLVVVATARRAGRR